MDSSCPPGGTCFQDTEELDPVQRAVKDLKENSLDRLSDEELAGLIRRKVIYADHKLVIFNKPYGLPMHGQYLNCLGVCVV